MIYHDSDKEPKFVDLGLYETINDLKGMHEDWWEVANSRRPQLMAYDST